MNVDLARYSASSLNRGRSLPVELLWLVISASFFRHPLAVWNGVKIFMLRLFGATVGNGVIIKPGVRVKFPWKLRLGDNTWIGENVWIDNLECVDIGSNVCISQDALLLCGNHDYRSESFDLTALPIAVEAGAWVGARAVVCPGVRVASHAVLTAGSVATGDLEAFGVYQGNPARLKRMRVLRTERSPVARTKGQ